MRKKRLSVIVQKTFVFPTSGETVFRKIHKLKTLQYIAKPFAGFEPAGKEMKVWAVGSTSSYRFKLFGFIPYSTNSIRVIRFEPDGVSSCEGNERVPVWNHDICLVPIGQEHTGYTDRVEIKAGWKSIFIWLWAKAFYAHRQRRWIALLKKEA